MTDLKVLDDAVPAEVKTSRYLACDLTEDEQRERGLLLANLGTEIDATKAEAKRIAGEFKTKIEEIEGKAAMVRTMVLTRREHRETVCTEYFNTKKNEVYVARDDLGTIVDTRPMTDRERQMLLPNLAARENGDKKTPQVNIYEDRKCTECGAKGATDNGLCVRCGGGDAAIEEVVKDTLGIGDGQKRSRSRSARAGN